MLGASFRGWGRLIEAKRRREMLEWLFGDGLEGLHEGVQQAARPMIDELQAASAHARQEAEATSERLREEMAAKGLEPLATGASAPVFKPEAVLSAEMIEAGLGWISASTSAGRRPTPLSAARILQQVIIAVLLGKRGPQRSAGDEALPGSRGE